jgi:AraC-like DNA-binding protein
MEAKAKKILLIDPHRSSYCLKVSSFLNDYDSIIKTEHRDAFEFFINNHFDISLVLLFHSSDFPCEDFLRYLRLIEPLIPILIITEESSEEFVATIFRIGAGDYYKKFQPLHELKALISNLLAPKIPYKAGRRHTVYCIYKAIEYINRNFCNNIRLYMAAKEANMSVSCFERTFKKIVGTNFSSYINKMRIAKSVDMLKKTNYPISDIAVACGYINQTHFNRTFKKIMKIPPKKLKKTFVKA